MLASNFRAGGRLAGCFGQTYLAKDGVLCKSGLNGVRRLATGAQVDRLAGYTAFKTLRVSQAAPNVLNVEFYRPEVLNAMSMDMFHEIKACFERIHLDTHFRAVVLTGYGKLFTAGLDLMNAQEVFAPTEEGTDVGRKCLQMNAYIEQIQASTHSVYKCQKPIIAAVQAGVIGAGINIFGAVDIRYCTKDAWFTIKEVDIAIAADIGALQWIPPAIGNGSLFNELVYTGRRFDASEAKDLGLVSRILPDIEATKAAAIETASAIAAKSPVAVQGAKNALLFSRDHSVADGLKFQASWNMGALQTVDIMKSAMSVLTKSKTPPEFDDLISVPK